MNEVLTVISYYKIISGRSIPFQVCGLKGSDLS